MYDQMLRAYVNLKHLSFFARMSLCQKEVCARLWEKNNSYHKSATALKPSQIKFDSRYLVVEKSL